MLGLCRQWPWSRRRIKKKSPFANTKLPTLRFRSEFVCKPSHCSSQRAEGCYVTAGGWYESCGEYSGSFLSVQTGVKVKSKDGGGLSQSKSWDILFELGLYDQDVPTISYQTGWASLENEKMDGILLPPVKCMSQYLLQNGWMSLTYLGNDLSSGFYISIVWFCVR